jgi:hypothetical protein
MLQLNKNIKNPGRMAVWKNYIEYSMHIWDIYVTFAKRRGILLGWLSFD